MRREREDVAGVWGYGRCERGKESWRKWRVVRREKGRRGMPEKQKDPEISNREVKGERDDGVPSERVWRR